MPLDNSTVQKISKKYSSSTTRHWVKPSTEVLNSIEEILLRNKVKALESIPSKRLNKDNMALTGLIADIMTDLNRSKLPKTVDVRDFDHDYQLKRQRALLNLHSNELKIVERLEDTLVGEEDKLKEISKFLNSYEKLTKEEQTKLGDVIGQVEVQEENITGLDEMDDDELNPLLKDLDSELERISQSSLQLQRLAAQLDRFL